MPLRNIFNELLIKQHKQLFIQKRNTESAEEDGDLINLQQQGCGQSNNVASPNNHGIFAHDFDT